MAQDDKRTYELLLHATDKGLETLAPVSFQAEEALSAPFRVVVDTRTMFPGDPAAIDPSAWLRKKMAVGLARGGDPTWFHGIVVAVEHLGADHKQHQLYRLELAPAFSLLMHTRRTRVFNDQKVLEVVKSVLSDGGVSGLDLKAGGAAGVQRHITQFEESDFAFVSRLLEQEGACYWFTHTKTAHTMVIGDAATHHPGKDAAIHAAFAAAKEMAAASEGVVTTLSRRHEIVSKDASVRDYSESHPKQASLGQKSVLSDKAPGAGGQHHEADYHVTASDNDASAYAARLAESMTSRSCRLVGSSSMLPFRAGARVAVHGHDGYDEHMLLADVKHNFADDTYRNSFSAAPVSRLPWRPARRTPIPRIDGLVPAVVTNTAGAQGQGDDGAYKVRLLNSDDTHERIVRMAQPYTGPGQGVHFPLPVNTEVMLAHAYGHPDRPIIAGAMHNAEDASQVMEANKTQCVVRSAANASLVFEDVKDSEWLRLTSKSGNLLSFEDSSGAELAHLNAVKDLTVEVKEAETRHVGTDQTEKVDGSVQVTIGKDQTIAIKGKRTETIEGDHTGTISGKADVSVTKDAVGTFSAGLTATVTKDMKLTCDGKGLWMAKKDMLLETDAQLSITSAKKTTWSADGIKIDSKGDITITAGQSSISMKKSGEIVIKGSKIKIEGSGDVVIKGSKTAVN